MRKLVATSILAALLIASVASGAVTKTVKVRDDFFKPTAVTIKKGDTVKWSWGADGTKHKHTVSAKSGKWTSANKKTGTYTHTFKNAGKFTVLCTTHPQKMVMKVTVEK
jgi:plastocyanin